MAEQSCSAVRSEASVTTSTCSSGGKDRWPAGAWSVLESAQTVVEEAGPPQGNGVATTLELGSNGAIGGLISLLHPENETATEGE